MKMLKTLLFGAGPGAGFFIDNNLHEREFVGLLDNDEAKVGKSFFGLPVYSPKSLVDIDFDEIVITTQWAMAVKSQLTDEFNLPESKIVLPAKNQLKVERPFYNDNSAELARCIIKGLNKLARLEKTPLVIDFGTLLGLVRGKDIIPWDDDVDFAAPQEYAAQVESIVKKFVADNPHVDWRIERVVDGKQLATAILLKFTSVTDDLICFTSSISFRRAQDGKSIHLPSMGMWYAPEHHFTTFETIEWKDEAIQVPAQYIEYLTFQYGDWNTPKKDIKLTDYAHLQEVGFDEIKSEKRILQNITITNAT
jgi:lipopolysaccharide cholinephosphotransferase